MQLLSHFLSNIILHYDLGCIKFGRLVGFKVNKIIFMLICAIYKTAIKSFTKMQCQ